MSKRLLPPVLTFARPTHHPTHQQAQGVRGYSISGRHASPQGLEIALCDAEQAIREWRESRRQLNTISGHAPTPTRDTRTRQE
jgi:hypothetical protein